MLNKGIAITLDDNQEYAIIETIEIHNIVYYLLTSTSNEKELKICKIFADEVGIAVIEVDNQEFKSVFPIFYEKSKKTLKEYNIDINF